MIRGNAPRVRQTKRGSCSVCHRSYQVTHRDVLISHPEPADPNAAVRLAPMRCAGSGQAPRGRS